MISPVSLFCTSFDHFSACFSPFSCSQDFYWSCVSCVWSSSLSRHGTSQPRQNIGKESKANKIQMMAVPSHSPTRGHLAGHEQKKMAHLMNYYYHHVLHTMRHTKPERMCVVKRCGPHHHHHHHVFSEFLC
jgi:hypothetical protein